MSHCPQQEFLTAVRRLRDVRSGRLRGQWLAGRYAANVTPGTLEPQAAATLAASVYGPREAGLGVDAIVYVVSAAGTPIAWVTRDAAVVAPPARLDAYQRRHQQRVVEALGRMSRHAVLSLVMLAGHAGARVPQREHAPDDGPSVLVADPSRPTLTSWARLGPHLAASREHLRRVTGADRDVLVVCAAGYGAYGDRAEQLRLEVLCVIEQIAETATLAAAVVGDWLHAEGGTARIATAERIAEAFATAYAGVHSGKQAFAAVERDARGWTASLQRAGIPHALFDLAAFTAQLFTDDVYPVALDDGRIAVFRRHTVPGTGRAER